MSCEPVIVIVTQRHFLFCFSPFLRHVWAVFSGLLLVFSLFFGPFVGLLTLVASFRHTFSFFRGFSLWIAEFSLGKANSSFGLPAIDMCIWAFSFSQNPMKYCTCHCSAVQVFELFNLSWAFPARAGRELRLPPPRHHLHFPPSQSEFQSQSCTKSVRMLDIIVWLANISALILR